MPYILNRYDGTELTVLDDGTVNVTASSINLIGRNYYGYGEKQNENFVYLLENFSNNEPPLHPIKGQLWFDSGTTEDPVNLLKSYNGSTWDVVGSAVTSDSPPDSSAIGSFWLKKPYNVLYVYTGTEWTFVGPETAEGFDTTRAESTTLPDTSNVLHPVILFKSRGKVLAIASDVPFTIKADSFIEGFTDLVAGITVSSLMNLKGDLIGRADRATKLENTRLINGVGFNGESNITIRAATPNLLTPGNYIIGDEFNGGSPEIWNVDATSLNAPNKIVARDINGNFSAKVITAETFAGELRGNVTTTEGTSYFDVCYANSFVGATLTGNAATATRLQTPRKINGVLFSGIEDITVPANAETLTGSFLSTGVTTSNLVKVGKLKDLLVEDAGIALGTESARVRLTVVSNTPSLNSTTGTLKIGSTVTSDFNFISSTVATSLGGLSKSSFIPENDQGSNLGLPARKFDRIYANDFVGTSTNTINIFGGVVNSIPYQRSANLTSFTNSGIAGDVLVVDSDNQIKWKRLGTWENVPNEVVIRNADGDFAARNLIGNAATATKLQTKRKINGVDFDGTEDITVSDPNSGTPVGAILHFPTDNLPAGWILCDGSFYSTTLYPLLFSKIGYTYGGSGTSFRVPDLRGEFIRSADLGKGVDTGRAIGSRQKGSLIGFDESYDAVWNLSVITDGAADSSAALGMDIFNRSEYTSARMTGAGTTSKIDLTVNNPSVGWVGVARPRNVALVACIKAYGTVDDPDQLLAADVIASIGRINNYTITSGNTVYSTTGYTNQIGSWNNSRNYFDVFPPSGKTMSNLVAFVPSIAVIYFEGGVNGDDAMRCTWTSLSDRIRVYVQNTEQRSTPAANYMAVWR